MAVAADVRELWGRSIISPVAWLLQFSYCIGLGLVFALSDPRRFGGPTWSELRDYGIDTLGWTYVVLGAALFLSVFLRRRAVSVVFGLAAVAHMLLAASFVVTALNETAVIPMDFPRPALTGIPTYVFVAFLYAVNSRLYWPPLGSTRRDTVA